MNNVVIEALNGLHGASIIQAFKALGINTESYKGVQTRVSGHSYRFYGIINGKFGLHCERDANNVEILTLEEFIQRTKKEKTTNKTISNMKVKVVKELQFGNEKRTVTVVTLIDEGRVKTGYAIGLPEDAPKSDDAEAVKEAELLADTIATGRALKEKTNLTPDMVIGIGMDKKYILAAIAENTIRAIGKGSLVKGIKERKQKS